MSDDYTLLVNAERTVLVRIWRDGTTEVATREDAGATWGPPTVVEPESAAA